MGHEPDANVDEEGDEESQRVPRLAIERIAHAASPAGLRARPPVVEISKIETRTLGPSPATAWNASGSVRAFHWNHNRRFRFAYRVLRLAPLWVGAGRGGPGSTTSPGPSLKRVRLPAPNVTGRRLLDFVPARGFDACMRLRAPRHTFKSSGGARYAVFLPGGSANGYRAGRPQS